MPRRTNTRERLIETAADLFCRQGYAHTGVNEIMQRAKTTSGSFYHFFPTKEDLVLAVVDHIGESFDSEIFCSAVTVVADPVDRVFAVIDSYRLRLEDNDFALGSPLGTLAAELSASHPQVRERLAGLFAGWTDRMQFLLEEAGNRLPSDLDRRALSEFILSAVEGAVLQARASRSLAPFDATVAGLRRHFELLAATRQPTLAPEARPRPAPAARRSTADWRAW
ncbi:MAG: TetR/AcrR family transcriptional regulator [Thermoanaerobaculales bacterium]|nr:TetR/AcrR family transcriptional regulator [Thermoanaerobaculales bacterium]